MAEKTFVTVPALVKALNTACIESRIEDAKEIIEMLFKNDVPLQVNFEKHITYALCFACKEIVWTPNNEVHGLHCGHYYHFNCLREMIKQETNGNISSAQEKNICTTCKDIPDTESRANFHILAKLFDSSEFTSSYVETKSADYTCS